MSLKKPKVKKHFFNTVIPENHYQLVKERLQLLVIIAGIYFLFYLLNIGCPIRFITGIPCPGCGMTRASIALLHLDFAKALYFHPLIFLTPVIVILYLFDFYINQRLLKALWFIIIVVFLVVYLIRLFITHSAVVLIDIHSGIMIELYQLIFGGR